MKKDPAAKKEEQERKAKEAAIQAKADAITHKSARLSRYTAFLYHHMIGYLFVIIGGFAIALACIVIGLLVLWDKSTANMSTPLIVVGSAFTAIGIFFTIIYVHKRHQAVRQRPILSKQIELMNYEFEHPNEPEDAKAARLLKARPYFQKLLDDGIIRRRDYERALKEVGIPLDPPQGKEEKTGESQE